MGIKFYWGPMESGKTHQLVSLAQQCKYANKATPTIKSLYTHTSSLLRRAAKTHPNKSLDADTQRKSIQSSAGSVGGGCGGAH
jgi:thymidine kinase